MEPTEKLPKVFSELQKRFEGRIKCRCGNDNWKEFMYVELTESYISGCKKCGHSLDHKKD